MSNRVGAITKGLIKNNDTGDFRKFQFNPSGFSYSRGVTYASIEAPGMEYPDTQFVRGNAREFSVTLFFFDKPFTDKFKEYTWFFGALMTQEKNHTNFVKPPTATFVMGSWVRNVVVTNLDINVSEYDDNLNPTMFTCTLSLRQVIS